MSSGLPCDKFCFEGFLPQKKGRQTRLEMLKAEERSVIIYESPRRLVKTLRQLMEVVGEERRVCVSREISKLHEEHVRGSLKEVTAHFERVEPLGEIVIILGGRTDDADTVVEKEERTLDDPMRMLMGTGKKKNKYKD